jgi:excisionase family DNA binding protein
MSISLPSDAVEEIARHAAEIVLAELDARATREPPEWMSVERAADYMGCSPERIWKLKARGQIPYHQEGSRARVFLHRNDLDAFMSKSRHELVTRRDA